MSGTSPSTSSGGPSALSPRTSFLFSLTLRENLAFGDAEAPLPEVRRVAGEAGLAGDIEGFPDGYRTMVGERGVTLSGGQRQRAAIARALLLDAPVLVLDDVLSAVDSQTESRILQAVRRASRERTTLIIAHRLSTVKGRRCDLPARSGRGRGRAHRRARHPRAAGRRRRPLRLDLPASDAGRGAGPAVIPKRWRRSPSRSGKTREDRRLLSRVLPLPAALLAVRQPGSGAGAGEHRSAARRSLSHPDRD